MESLGDSAGLSTAALLSLHPDNMTLADQWPLTGRSQCTFRPQIIINILIWMRELLSETDKTGNNSAEIWQNRRNTSLVKVNYHHANHTGLTARIKKRQTLSCSHSHWSGSTVLQYAHYSMSAASSLPFWRWWYRSAGWQLALTWLKWQQKLLQHSSSSVRSLNTVKSSGQVPDEWEASPRVGGLVEPSSSSPRPPTPNPHPTPPVRQLASTHSKHTST